VRSYSKPNPEKPGGHEFPDSIDSFSGRAGWVFKISSVCVVMSDGVTERLLDIKWWTSVTFI
jgi:hypothetical protein